MLKKVIYVLVLMLTCISCSLFTSEKEGEPLAKVHDAYLYKEDIKDFNIPNGLTEKDSVAILIENIDGWATKQLLLHQAKENMSSSKQNEFKKLVEAYELDLFIDAYKNVYVQKNLNTIISDLDVKNYYKEHKESFLLKENLFKVRYIEMPLNFKDVSATKKIFARFNEEDQEELNKMRPGFINIDFNEEEKWKTYDELITDLPKLATISKSKIVNSKKAAQFKGSGYNYLLKIDKKLAVGNIAPIEHATSTIKQVLLNKRKLELQKKLEKEITKDALQTKDYTIFQ